MSDAKSKAGRGGYRPGAGRKASGDNPRTCTLYLPADTCKQLKALAAKHGVSQGRIVSVLVERAIGVFDVSF